MKTNLAYPSPYKTEAKTRARHTPLDEHLLHNARRLEATLCVDTCVCVQRVYAKQRRQRHVANQRFFACVNTNSKHLCFQSTSISNLFINMY